MSGPAGGGGADEKRRTRLPKVGSVGMVSCGGRKGRNVSAQMQPRPRRLDLLASGVGGQGTGREQDEGISKQADIVLLRWVMQTYH
jgi:hypothetical protein